MFELEKKHYQLQDLAPLAIAFVVIAIVLGVGGTILSEVQNSSGAVENSTSWNSTGQGIVALGTLSSWLPTIAIIVAAAVVVGIVVMYFRFG